MKKNKRILASIALIAVMILTVGCGQKSKPVATINGEPLTEASYMGYLFSVKMEMEQGFGPEIWDLEMEGESMEKIAKERALESAVAMSVTSAKAKEMKLKLTPEQKEEAASIAANYVEQLKEPLAEEGVTEDIIKEMMEDIVMSQNVLEELASNFTPIDDAEGFEMFAQENGMHLETVTAQHVLLGTIDEEGNPVTEDKLKVAEEKAKEVLEKALAGEDMGELAKTYSEDPGSKDEGGEYTFQRGEMVQGFEDAAFGGEEGKVYPEIVKTMHGYHVIKTIEIIKPTEEEMKEAFEENQKAEYINGEIDDWITSAEVEKTELYDTIKIKETASEAPAVDGEEQEKAPEVDAEEPEAEAGVDGEEAEVDGEEAEVDGEETEDVAEEIEEIEEQEEK